MSRARCQRLARELGATLDETRGAIYADAPRGQTWACSAGDLHTLASAYFPGEKAEAWRDLAPRMAYGLEPCPQGPGCDACGAEEKR